MGRKKSQKDLLFAKHLEFLMRELGLNQEQMAKKTGFSQQTISKWLGGFRPTWTNLSQLASANSVPEDYFSMPEIVVEGGRARREITLGMESELLKNETQFTLDNAFRSPDTTPGMKITSLPKLIEALREYAKERGKKTEVARACGVSRQAVDQWMREKTKPSADAVFHLLAVLQGKAKQ
jgi:transcriptional regulator with XRE-family HTH domain